MEVYIAFGNIHCSKECADNHYEDGYPPEHEIRRAHLPLSGRSFGLLAELLLDRATCDTCGLNLRDIARNPATA